MSTSELTLEDLDSVILVTGMQQNVFVACMVLHLEGAAFKNVFHLISLQTVSHSPGLMLVKSILIRGVELHALRKFDSFLVHILAKIVTPIIAIKIVNIDYLVDLVIRESHDFG
jgi:hypothetical protein